MLRTWYGAGLIAGLAVFLWGGLSKGMLSIGGESTYKQVSPEAIAALANMKQPGMYVFPYTNNSTEMAKMLETSPSGIMIYAPPGTPINMGSLLGIQAMSDILACLVAACIFSLALPRLPTFASRVGFVLALGAFSFLIAEVPYWNWYRFPTDFTAFGLLFKFSTALLTGVVLSLLMGRQKAV
jgi:hypothetical protein